MRCPKDRQADLTSFSLEKGLKAEHCPTCQGNWIPVESYETWREPQRHPGDVPLPKTLEIDFEPSPFDARAALCPECSCYLARAKVGISHPFYVERCPNCGGIWCDRGEWEVLRELGLYTAIEQLFSNEWQGRVREMSQTEQERRATINKLGEDLAKQLFELADRLENHPNGDFGVAYLMRRFDK